MKETDIRPGVLFDEYLKLAASDVETYFRDAEVNPINCPACGEKGHLAFVKHGFHYDECPACNTLFVSPRPAASAFEKYYTDAPSVIFWSTNFYRDTEKARRELLWKPKAMLLKEILERNGLEPSDTSVVDIGGGYGIFAQEISKLAFKNPVVIEPGPSLADACREKGLNVVEKFLEDVIQSELPIGEKCFVSYELFEHLHCPESFLEHLAKLMGPSDIFTFSTLSGMGLDIRVLWSKSKSVSPPHHLNFFNPKSIAVLLEKTGFEVLEVFTPGKLDISILENSAEEIRDHFWKYAILNATEEQKAVLQTSLANANLSSHMMVVCRRKNYSRG
jgi:SAM-dependent methyltransferase